MTTILACYLAGVFCTRATIWFYDDLRLEAYPNLTAFVWPLAIAYAITRTNFPRGPPLPGRGYQ